MENCPSPDSELKVDHESLRKFCLSLPSVTEDIKWGADLCFCIGEKMFCVTGLQQPFQASFKVKDDEFDELTSRNGIIPAPYVARYKWILITDPSVLKKKDCEHYIKQSYELVKEKLPRKIKEKLKAGN